MVIISPNSVVSYYNHIGYFGYYDFLKNQPNSDRLSNHYNQRSPIPKNKSNSDRSKQGA